MLNNVLRTVFGVPESEKNSSVENNNTNNKEDSNQSIILNSSDIQPNDDVINKMNGQCSSELIRGNAPNVLLGLDDLSTGNCVLYVISY